MSILFSKKSIRNRFLLQLFIASTTLIVIFSFLLYSYIKQSIYEERKEEVVLLAKHIINNEALDSTVLQDTDILLGVSVEMISMKIKFTDTIFRDITLDDRHFIVLIYPYELNEGNYLKITKDITNTKNLLAKILNHILVINWIAFFIILLYAVILSRMLISPITALTTRLSDMNENFITPIKIDTLPVEFHPLGDGINKLIHRIQTFVKYQKELFIGTAHELKTPLAVMKLKNQVTAIKRREPEEYLEALKVSNTSIDEMNKIISDILNIGRQESAQFEIPIKIDVIEYLKRKGKDFNLLALSENKILELSFEAKSFNATIQLSLLNQIMQNFLQNAIKFTAENKKIIFSAKKSKRDGMLLIEVIDEGVGIDESIDIFAPFTRTGDKSGVGLGLFLAKSAADAMGAKIYIKNRENRQGTVASLELGAELCCDISNDK